MFRLANFSDEVDELYEYLSSISSKVIYNALDIWAGETSAVLDVYLTHFAQNVEGIYDGGYFEGISEYLSPAIVRPGINAMADRIKNNLSWINDDSRIGMEFLMRKISRMKKKMVDPQEYYTFDLFEEFLFFFMFSSYDPEIYKVEEDPFIITSDEEIAASAEKLYTEFKVGEELEAEIGEEGLGRKYADYLAHAIHRIDKMELWSSEEAGFESLFFWDTDYAMIFTDSFVEGIKKLVGGTASIYGYGYKNVEEIFSDVEIKAPLLLVGTETAFDVIGEAAQEKIFEAMKNLPVPEPDGDFETWEGEEGLSEEDWPFS